MGKRSKSGDRPPSVPIPQHQQQEDDFDKKQNEEGDLNIDFSLSDLYLYLYGFQSHHPLCLLLLHINYIKLQRRSNNFHGLKIKTKRFLGLKPVQIQV